MIGVCFWKRGTVVGRDWSWCCWTGWEMPYVVDQRERATKSNWGKDFSLLFWTKIRRTGNRIVQTPLKKYERTDRRGATYSILQSQRIVPVADRNYSL